MRPEVHMKRRAMGDTPTSLRGVFGARRCLPHVLTRQATHFLGCSGGWIESFHLSTSLCAPIKTSWNQSIDQPYRQSAWMGKFSEYRACIPRCKLPVPAELDSVGLCVYHFTWSVEEACAEMHRQVALRKATVERLAEMAAYVSECALLLARVSSNLCLSDDLKRRILCAFLSLMNLRENLERVPSGHAPEIPLPAPGLFPSPPVVQP